MWTHLNFPQRSTTDILENEWRRQNRLSTGGRGKENRPNAWSISGLPSRVSCSLPAQRNTCDSDMRVQSRSFQPIESQENILFGLESSTQRQEIFADKRNQFADQFQNSQPFGDYSSLQRETTNFCGEPAFKKHCPSKPEIFCDSDVFLAKVKLSPIKLFTLDEDQFHHSRKRKCMDTDSPYNSSNMSGFSGSVINSPSNNTTFHHASGTLSDNRYSLNFSTPVVDNSAFQDYIDEESKENRSRSFLSPETQESFSSENVFGRMTPNKCLLDEDPGVHFVQPQLSPKFNSLSQEVLFLRPMSTSDKDERKYNIRKASTSCNRS